MPPANSTKRPTTRRWFLRTALAAAGLGAGTGLYTWKLEPHWVEFIGHPLPVAKLPKEWQGRQLVQLSDLHIGPRVEDAFLLRIFQQVQEMAPDLVVYTGDFTSFEEGIFEHVRRAFAHLPRGKRGTLGILGNHDYGRNWSHPEVADQLARLATEAGVRMLRNEVAEVEGLQIAGLDDLWANQFNPGLALPRLAADKPAVVLSHNPDTADEPGWGNYAGWILAGHTHGGQCKPPFLPPPLLPVRNRRYTAGEFALDHHRRLYINRGLGHLIQVRFNVRPEVTVHRLES